MPKTVRDDAAKPVPKRLIEAFLDGELDEHANSDVSRRIRTDSAGSTTLQRYRAINDGLHALFDPILTEPVPASMRALFAHHLP